MNQCFGLKPGIVTDEEKEHAALVREIAARGMVLLENSGVLPLKAGSKTALYGYGARNTVTCGLGAASFQSRETVKMAVTGVWSWRSAAACAGLAGTAWLLGTAAEVKRS